MDIARISENEPNVSGTSGASTPPAKTTSAAPCLIARKASPRAIAPAAQPLPFARVGPVAPMSIAILVEAEPTKTESASIGLTARNPDRA